LTLSGESVNVRAGALTIESLADTSTFTSRQTNVGGSLSVDVTTGQVSGSANYGKERQNGDFRSVETQAGITTGSGGYTIDVRGRTDLTGGVIAGSTDASRNILTTDTLTTRDGFTGFTVTGALSPKYGLHHCSICV
jgi:filamentous hemagglutinin